MAIADGCSLGPHQPSSFNLARYRVSGLQSILGLRIFLLHDLRLVLVLPRILLRDLILGLSEMKTY
jgi:hypothetical protein